MSNDIAKALKIIQVKTGMNLDEIADKIGKSRPYLSLVKKKGEPIEILESLKIAFKDELEDVIFSNISSNNKPSSITEGDLVNLILENNAMLSVSLDAMAELLASSSKRTVSEARSSLAMAVENRKQILIQNNKS